MDERQRLIDRIKKLEAERIQWMAISWPVEEWLGGRITTNQLRETVAPLIDNLSELPTEKEPSL